LRPIKAESLNSKVVEITGKSEEQVNKVIEFYYKTLRATLSEMKFNNVIVEGLGKFYIKERFLDRMYNRYLGMKEYLDMHPKEGIRREAIMRSVNERILDIERIRGYLQERNDRKSKMKEIKKLYKDAKVTKDLEG
jgi:hypothetical protein